MAFMQGIYQKQSSRGEAMLSTVRFNCASTDAAQSSVHLSKLKLILMVTTALAGVAVTTISLIEPVAAAPLCGGTVTDGAVLTCTGQLNDTHSLDTGSHSNVVVNVDGNTDWINPSTIISNAGGSNITINIEDGATLTTSTGPAISLSGGSGTINIAGTVNHLNGSPNLISLQGDENNHYEVILLPGSSLIAYDGGHSIHSTARLTLQSAEINVAFNVQAEGNDDTFRFFREDNVGYHTGLDNYIKSDNTGFEVFEVAKGDYYLSRMSGGPKRDLRVTGGRLTIEGDHNADAFVLVNGIFATPYGSDASMTGNITVAGGRLELSKTLNVGGNVEFQSGSTFAVNLDFSTGKLAVQGTVNIENDTTLAIHPGYAFASGPLTVLTAGGGITGTFSTVTVQGGSTLSAIADYTSNEMTITLGVDGGHGSHGGHLVPAATSPSGTSAASVLDAARGNVQMSNLIAVLDALPAAQKAAALTSISGQSTATISSVPTNAVSSVVSTVLNHNSMAPGASAPARFGSPDGGNRSGVSTGEQAPAHNEGAWISVIGGFGSTDAKQGSAGTSSRTGGLAGGFDFPLHEEALTAGVSFGYVGSNTDIDGNGGTADAQAGFGGLYARLEQWGLRLDGTLLGGYHTTDQKRNVTIGTATRTAESDFDGYSLGGGVQVSKGFDIVKRDDFDAVLRPFVGLNAQRYWQDSYTETGAGTANLVFGRMTRDSVVGRLGASWELGYMANQATRVAPLLSLGWAHTFTDTAQTMDAAFALLPGSRFSVHGADMSRDALEIGLGLDVIQLDSGLTFTAGYGGTLSSDAKDHSFNLRAKWAL